MSPREMRLLRELINNERVLVKDLRVRIGALNPAQITFSLRRKGWNIRTGFVQVQDRDGRLCNTGYYWMPGEEKAKAEEYLKKTNGAGATAPLAKCDALAWKTISSVFHHTKGGIKC